MDVKNAFLHRDVSEEIYMEHSQGFMQDSSLVRRLKKSLCWCNYMHNILPNIHYQPGFVISGVDALYVSIIDRFLCLFSIAR